MTINRIIFILIFIYCISSLIAQVPPHPLKSGQIPNELVSDDFHSFSFSKNRSMVNNILVLRVDFPNLSFNLTESFPSYHPHNEEYFNKYMQHLKNFYLDASHGQYELEYYIAPAVYTVSQNAEWYGNDRYESERRVLLIQELINLADNDIDFGQYGGLIVFHAGAGQESDIYNTQKHTMWSTFLSKNSFKNVLDPDNVNYQGIPTADGSFITRLAFLPESQCHADFPADENHHFEILGALAHQFGRVLGLPTLFDNVSSNGISAGIGNFGIMGTGLWNNNGKIPCLPSAWTRYYAGWESPVVIKGNQENIQITYPMSKNEQLKKLFKVEISEKEYFLIENRQQNFIKDFVEYNGQIAEFPLHSFELLPPDEQDYYPGLPYNIPIVNLMKNNLRGSEWDYFLPYINANTGQFQDGSGLLIWHIDENVIAENIERNTINGDHRHRGVDLEEADGIQHMDSNLPHPYMRGGPFDSFRAGNNDYFGKKINPETGYYSFPDASSYYGGVSFEIYNISVADTIMTFSVRFEPWSQADFYYENYLETFAYDFNENGINEVHYFHADGFLSVFENNQIIHYYHLECDTISYNYTFNGHNLLAIPAQDKFFDTQAKLIIWNGSDLELKWQKDNAFWVGSPVYIDKEWLINSQLIKWVLPVKNQTGSYIYLLDENFSEIITESLTGELVSNIVYNGLDLQFLTYSENQINLYMFTNSLTLLKSLNFDKSAKGKFTLYQGDFLNIDNNFNFIHYSDTEMNRFFVYDGQFNERYYDFPYQLTGQVVFHDVNSNGKADVILTHANGILVYSLNGSLMKDIKIDYPNYNDLSGSGLIAWNWANDGRTFYMGGFSNNRILFFDNNFNEIDGLSKTLAMPVRSLPFICTQNDSVFAYQATDFGRVFNIHLSDAINTDNLYWNQALGNYYRNSHWVAELKNDYSHTNEVFIKNENYIYPNPWIKRHYSELKFNIMTSIDVDVNIKIYSISGQLLAEFTEFSEAFTVSTDRFNFNPEKWSSGVYFAIINAKDSSLKIKFAIER